MKKKDFLDLLGDIDGELVEDAAPKTRDDITLLRRKTTPWIKFIAVAACCAFILCGVFVAGNLIEKQIYFDGYESDVNNLGEESKEHSNGVDDNNDQVGGDNYENVAPDNGIEDPVDDDRDVYPNLGDEDNELPNQGNDGQETTFDEGVEVTKNDDYIPDNGGDSPSDIEKNEHNSFLLALEEKGLYGELAFETNVAYWQDSDLCPKGIYLNPRLLSLLTDIFYCADGEVVMVKNILELANESVSFNHIGFDGYNCIITVYDNGYLHMLDTFYDVGIDITDKILYNAKTEGVPHGDFSWNEREDNWEIGSDEEEKKEHESTDKDSPVEKDSRD